MCCGKKKSAKPPPNPKEAADATPVVTPMAASTTPAPTSNDQNSKDHKTSEHPSNDGAPVEQIKPRTFEHDAKQKEIAKGKKVPKTKYPTMSDVAFDFSGSKKDEDATQKDTKENSKKASKEEPKQTSKDGPKKAEDKTPALEPTQE
ncbi:hypothetical protein DdX_20650 [Ditylenchus destructor]|uniref:Uncharacterized protein n=1 Tax=Ditylenchus destructor TaxID=166010 RepID=A0AAD4MKZ2_9BILA|nr:hypothetical protein DdX_20650 [Ditylenchus destructor]